MALYPPYSTRFIAGVVKTTPATSITYTVPAGKVAIVSCLTAGDIAAGPNGAGFYITPAGGTAGYIAILSLPTATTFETGLWTGHVVLIAGETLTATFIGTTAGTYVTASGYLITT